MLKKYKLYDAITTIETWQKLLNKQSADIVIFFPQTHFTYCIYMSNHWIDKQVREPLSRLGKTCFPSSKTPKKFHACPSK